MTRLGVVSLAILLLADFQPARASESIVAEGVVSAPVTAVWYAWTTTEGLKSWLAPHAEMDLRIGGLMRSNYDPEGELGGPGTIENRVLAVGLGFGADEESQRLKEFFRRGNESTLVQLQKRFRPGLP